MAYSSANDRYSKLQIEVDVNDESLKIFGGDLISVQSQLRLLRRELTVATDPKEILILNNAVNQLQQQLLLTRERSRDLFGALSLLPGPLGTFAFQAERAFRFIQLITTTPLANWANQFKSVFGGLGGENFANIQNIPRIGNPEISNVKKDESFIQTSGNVAAGGGAIVGGTSALNAQKAAADAAKLAQMQYGEAIAASAVQNLNAVGREATLNKVYKEGTNELKELVVTAKGGVVGFGQLAVSTQTLSKEEVILASDTRTLSQVTKALKEGTNELYIAEDAATVSTNLLTTAENANTVAAEENAVATGLLSKAWKEIASIGLDILLPIFALVVSGWVLYKKEQDEVINSSNLLARAIKDQKELLDLDQADAKRRNEKRTAELKAVNASDRLLQKEAIKDAKTDVERLTTDLVDARKKQDEAMQQINNSEEGLLSVFGVGKDAQKKLEDNYTAAIALTDDVEKKLKDAKTKASVDNSKLTEVTNKEAYADAVRNLDAKIALEIEKYNTSDKVLKDYYTKRNKLVDDFNVNIHLSQAERDEREKQQKKIINDALIDDTVKFLKNDKAVIDKSLEDEAKDTEHYFDLKILQANKEAEIEKAQAGKDAHSKAAVILEAETKLNKNLDDIYIARKNAQLKLLKETQQGLTEYTDEYYQNELDIIDKNEFIELANYEGNEKMQTAIRAKYAKQRLDLESKQLMDSASLQKKLAENIEGDLSGDKNTFKNIDKKYKLLQEALNNEYQARIKNAKKTNADIAAIEAQYNKESQDLNVKKLEEKQFYEKKIVDLAARTGEFLVGIGEAEMAANQGKNRAKFNDAKKYAIAGIWLEKAAALGSIYMNTSKAVAADVAASPLTFGEPWATIDTIIGIAQGAAVITAGAVAASSINGTDFQPTNTNTGMGKNYGQGGMIDGPSHNQGGVSINAEGGEAVMTRGAVTAFAPLLSLLNQAGGGTSFGNMVNQAKFDNPRTQGGITEPQILKTYVVESDLTNAQQRVARLKDLSTL